MCIQLCSLFIILVELGSCGVKGVLKWQVLIFVSSAHPGSMQCLNSWDSVEQCWPLHGREHLLGLISMLSPIVSSCRS